MAEKRCPSCLREYDGERCSCGYPEKGQNAAHQLPVGTILRGRYQIGKALGQGGFGITYLAWDTLMQEKVAVKEFYPGSTVNRNTAFFHHKFGISRIKRNLKNKITVTLTAALNDLCRTIDVPLHDMSAQTVAQTERTLQIHRRTDRKHSEIGTFQTLFKSVKCQYIRRS